MDIDLQIGDTILTGRFKNKKVVVKEFGVDDKGQPTVNGRPILKFRIKKLRLVDRKKEDPLKKFTKKVLKKKLRKVRFSQK